MMYVVQVVGGKEKHVLGLVERLVDDGLVQECFIPQYEIQKRVRGEWRLRTEILLPGYLFVVTRQPEKLAAQLRRVPSFTRMLGNNDIFTPLDDQEVSFIDAFTGKTIVSWACRKA